VNELEEIFGPQVRKSPQHAGVDGLDQFWLLRDNQKQACFDNQA
jgi:hypothetical protein